MFDEDLFNPKPVLPMQRFKKKPHYVDAFQLTPDWISQTLGLSRSVVSTQVCIVVGQLSIFSDHADIWRSDRPQRANLWWWIVTESNGEMYGLEPDLFNKTFIKAE